jgi:SAM-dependent methyltransferase
MDHPVFPRDLLLNDPDRGRRLIQEFYGQYHKKPKDPSHQRKGEYDDEQAAFFRKALAARGFTPAHTGLDIGCRVGVMIKLVGTINWLGVDIDPKPLQVAQDAGIPCIEMDFASALGFRDETVDAVMMTAVLEHLAYPAISVREINRILKKKPDSIFLGSVPLDYHLHRRWKVMRGKRLSGEQTHVHHFSFQELDRLLRFYFDEVEYLPLTGTAVRYPWLQLSYNLFVRDIAWAASSPKINPGVWDVRADKGRKSRREPI